MSKTRSSFLKRQKEVARQARQQEKAARRLEAKQKKAAEGADPNAEVEDPDLAGIVLGPQPTAGEADPQDDADAEEPET